MRFLKTLLPIAALASLMLIAGCSDLFQKDIVKKKIESNRFKANCELNVDDFKLILEEPIEESIDCLGRNLKLFVKLVESNRPGYLSRVALENYINKNAKDIKPEVFRALRAVFDINYLVYGEDKNYISLENIEALIEFAKIFNEKASTNFGPIFKSHETLKYEQYRAQRDERIKPAALVISQSLKKLFKENRRGEIHSLNILNLLESFTTENNEEAMAKVSKLLFMKKILLGGEKEIITHEELYRLIENFSSYTLLALDAFKFKHIEPNQEAKIHLINADLELVNSLLFNSSLQNRENERFFSLREAIAAIDLLAKDNDLQFDKYYDLMKEAKLILMGGKNSEIVTGGDLRRLFAHGLHLLKTGALYYRFWNSEREVLESTRPITHDFNDLITANTNDLSRVNDFVRIVKDYRFLKGNFKSAYYTDEYHRSPEAIYEIAIFEYGLSLVMKKYGCPNNTLGGKIICDTIASEKQAHWGKNYVYFKVEHVIDLVNRFRKVLLDLKLILPGRERKTAETITLLGSLFQYQSDNNKVFDVNEATEFGISLFSSIKIAESLDSYFLDLKAHGKCEIDEFGRISPTCFKERFFEGVCFNYPEQFPKLFASLGATIYENNKLVCRIPADVANLAYLERSVKAARNCHLYPGTSEEIYYSKGDVMSIFLAMMHIETTIIRWDVRTHNNKMDPAEVMDAYEIYSPALDGFLEKMPSFVKRLKKQIFQFMVKYEEVPDAKKPKSIVKFVRFLLSFNKEATATRKTIASLLVTIGEQGAPSLFDCSLMRNPNDIPDDYDPTLNAPVATLSEPLMSLSSEEFSEARKLLKEYSSKNPGVLD